MKKSKYLIFLAAVILSAALIGFQPLANAQRNPGTTFGDSDNDSVLENRSLVIQDSNNRVRARWDSTTGNPRILDEDGNIVFFLDADKTNAWMGGEGKSDGELILLPKSGKQKKL